MPASRPTLDNEGLIPIDIDQLSAHTLIQANSGGGKGYTTRRILEQTWDHGVPHWVLDPEGEMHTLRERFEYGLVAPSGGDAVASVKTAPLLVRRLLETGASAIIDIHAMGADERHEFVRVFAEAAMNQPRTRWRDVIVAIDEAHRFCPERSEAPSAATPAIKELLTAGRKRGYMVILAVQRLSTLHKSAAAECNNRLIGRTGLDTDQDRAGKALGLRSAADREALAHLKAGQFWVYGPAFCERPTLAKVGAIQTTHGREARNRPPTPGRGKVLAALGDLPAEVAKEATELEQLRAKVNELEVDCRIYKSRLGQPAFTEEERAALNKKLAEAFERNRQRDADHAQTKADRDKLQARLDDLIAATNRIAQKFAEANAMMDALCSPEGAAKARTFTDEQILAMRKSTHPMSHIIGHGIQTSTERDRFSGGGGSGTGIVVMSAAEVDRERADHEREHGSLSAMQRALLTVLAQHGRLPKGKVLLHARYAAGGAVSRCWAQMTGDGWVTSDNGIVDITDKGRKVLGPYRPLALGRALLAEVLPRLAPVEQSLLQVCADHYPTRLSKGRVLELAGYAAGGAVSRAWAHLAGLDYIHSDRGNVVAAKELCEP